MTNIGLGNIDRTDLLLTSLSIVAGLLIFNLVNNAPANENIALNNLESDLNITANKSIEKNQPSETTLEYGGPENINPVKRTYSYSDLNDTITFKFRVNLTSADQRFNKETYTVGATLTNTANDGYFRYHSEKIPSDEMFGIKEVTYNYSMGRLKYELGKLQSDGEPDAIEFRSILAHEGNSSGRPEFLSIDRTIFKVRKK